MCLQLFVVLILLFVFKQFVKHANACVLCFLKGVVVGLIVNFRKENVTKKRNRVVKNKWNKLTKMYLGKNVCHLNKLKDITRKLKYDL